MLTLAIMAAAASVAASPPGSTVTNPDWLMRPSGGDLAHAYPMIAAMFQIEGHATIDCLVDAGGALTNCAAIDEAPKSLGFGAAAVSMASAFHMRPKTVDGVSVAGGDVRIPIRFALPIGSAPESPPALQDPPPPSQQAIDLARRVLVAGDFTGYIRQKYKRLAEIVTSSGSPGVTLETRQRGAAAFQDAATAITTKEFEAAASLLAGYEPEDALTADAAFFESTVGQNYRAKRGKISAAAAKRLKPNQDRFHQAMRCGWSPDKNCLEAPPALTQQPAASANPEQLSLAQAIATADTTAMMGIVGSYEKMIAAVPETRRAALKEAVDAFVLAARVAEADAYADEFTAPELQAILAYKKGPGGRFEFEGATKLNMAFRRLELRFDQMVMADAKRQFCPGDTCSARLAAPVASTTEKEIDVPARSNLIPPFNSR